MSDWFEFKMSRICAEGGHVNEKAVRAVAKMAKARSGRPDIPGTYFEIELEGFPSDEEWPMLRIIASTDEMDRAEIAAVSVSDNTLRRLAAGIAAYFAIAESVEK